MFSAFSCIWSVVWDLQTNSADWPFILTGVLLLECWDVPENEEFQRFATHQALASVQQGNQDINTYSALPITPLLRLMAAMFLRLKLTPKCLFQLANTTHCDLNNNKTCTLQQLLAHVIDCAKNIVWHGYCIKYIYFYLFQINYSFCQHLAFLLIKYLFMLQGVSVKQEFEVPVCVYLYLYNKEQCKSVTKQNLFNEEKQAYIQHS